MPSADGIFVFFRLRLRTLGSRIDLVSEMEIGSPLEGQFRGFPEKVCIFTRLTINAADVSNV